MGTKKLANKPDTKTSKDFHVEFSNSSIDKFIPTFGDTKARHLEFAFPMPKGSHLKGLVLRVSKATKLKCFVLRYWFNNKLKRLSLGIFKSSYGVKEVNDKLYELVKEHTNDKGIWITDPSIAEKEKQKKITKKQIDDSKKLTVREVIELLCKAGFPQLYNRGGLSKRHISDCFRYLVGYNWRARHLRFTEDNEGNGVITFRINPVFSRFNKRTQVIKTWDKLFKRFPPGDKRYFLKKEKHFNPSGSTSLYDNDEFGKLLMSDFTTGKMKEYINLRPEFGTQRNCLSALKVLWNFASSTGILGEKPGVNPGTHVVLKKPRILKNPSSVYNDKIFTMEDLEKIHNACLALTDKFPYQGELIMLMMSCGRRFQELTKLRKDYVKLNERIIEIPNTISKIRENQFLTITEPVAMILERLDKINNRPGYEMFKNVPWLFPAIRYKSATNISPEYINSDRTRLKTITNCWNAIREMTGIFGAPRCFRKTFSSLAKDTLGATGPATKLTGHTQSATLDKHYYKTHKDKVITNADKVAKILTFPIKVA